MEGGSSNSLWTDVLLVRLLNIEHRHHFGPSAIVASAGLRPIKRLALSVAGAGNFAAVNVAHNLEALGSYDMTSNSDLRTLLWLRPALGDVVIRTAGLQWV